MDVPQTKVCSKCGIEKPLDDFYRAKRGLYGRRADCKQCKDKVSRLWLLNTPRAQEGNRQRAKEYYWKNKEKVLPRVREYAAKNRDKILEKHRDYWHNKTDKKAYNQKRSARRRERYQTDPEFREQRKKDGRHSAKIRKARMKGAEGSYTQKEWEDLCRKYDYRCLCCGKKKKLTADHVIPISRGGTNTIDNIQPLCATCNSSKNDKTIDFRPSGDRGPIPRWKQDRLL